MNPLETAALSIVMAWALCLYILECHTQHPAHTRQWLYWASGNACTKTGNVSKGVPPGDQGVAISVLGIVCR